MENIIYKAIINKLSELEKHPERVTEADKSAMEKLYSLLVKNLGISESAKWVVQSIVRKYRDASAFKLGNAYETRLVKQNIVTDNGATAILNLMCGLEASAFSHENAYLGVGDSDTEENASQTELQASSNKLLKQADGGFPKVAGRTVTFKATFNESEANFDWKEVGVFNAQSGGTMLNRRVGDFGRKSNGIWSLEIQISVASNV